MHGLYFLPYYVCFWSIYWSVDLCTAGHLNYLCTVAELHPAEPCDWICNFNKRFVIAPQTIQRKSRRWRTCWISWWVGFGRNVIWLNASQHELCNIELGLYIGPCKGGYPSPPSEFQNLVCRYFWRFPCCCRNFNMTSLRLCWPRLEENFTRLQSHTSGTAEHVFEWGGLELTGFEHC